MNIQKYVLPASAAAMVHVALFWFLPEESYRRIIEVPLAPRPPVEHDPIVQPPEEPDKTKVADEPVKALRGEPSPVELDEPVVTPVKTAMTFEREDPRPDVHVDTKRLPSVIGDPLGDPNGQLRPPSSIFDVRFLDGAPRAKVQLPPDYPYAMKQAGRSGTVLVEFEVDKSGRVTRAAALNYSEREFVEPALSAVRKWRFEPGRREGRAVPFRMTIPIEFNLEDAR